MYSKHHFTKLLHTGFWSMEEEQDSQMLVFNGGGGPVSMSYLV